MNLGRLRVPNRPAEGMYLHADPNSALPFESLRSTA